MPVEEPLREIIYYFHFREDQHISSDLAQLNYDKCLPDQFIILHRYRYLFLIEDIVRGNDEI